MDHKLFQADIIFFFKVINFFLTVINLHTFRDLIKVNFLHFQE